MPTAVEVSVYARRAMGIGSLLKCEERGEDYSMDECETQQETDGW